jgi:hypothetical protein
MSPSSFDLGGQGEHVAAFLPGDGDRVLGDGASDFLQSQAVLTDLDEVVLQLGLLAGYAAIQADQQAVQPPGQILVVWSRPRARPPDRLR